MVAESVSCGPDVQTHVEQIKPYLDAGFSHVFLHQVGPDQEGFIDFCQRELLPALREQPVASNA
jgi:coenzyme F420-dependent glucose-6-phosphate dehydrogenase